MTRDNRITDNLSQRSASDGAGLLPYFTSGFPDLPTSAALIRRADALGVPVVEIGIPYSDSIADGPVIQASFHRALENGHRVRHAFELVHGIRSAVRCGLVAMVSFSLVHRMGVMRFMARAAEAGFDGVILPDVPVEEAQTTAIAACDARLCHVGLVSPTTHADRRDAIARLSTGFIYRIAVTGTTGERDGLPPNLAGEVTALRSLSGLPVCVGFGVSKAAHVREVCAVADGAIVGSAIVRRVTNCVERGETRDALVDSVTGFMSELVRGT